MPQTEAASEERFQPQSWNREPLRWLRRQIKRSLAFDEESRSHALLWLEDTWALVGEDPRQQAVAMAACRTYAQCVRLGAESVRIGVDDEKAEQLEIRLARCEMQVAKLLRLAGLKAPGLNGKGHVKKGDVFSAPRPPTPPDQEIKALVAGDVDVAVTA